MNKMCETSDFQKFDTEVWDETNMC